MNPAPLKDYLNLYGAFLFLIVGVLFLYQTWRKNRNTHLLTVGFFVAFIGQFFQSLLLIQTVEGWGYFSSIGLLTWISYQVLFITMISAILGFFWIFLELTQSVRINSLSGGIVLILFTMYIWTFSFGLIVGDTALDAAIVYGNFMFSILLNIISLRSVYILYNVYKATGKEKIAAAQLLSFVLIEAWAFNAFFTGVFGVLAYNGLASFMYPDLQGIFDIIYYTGLVIFIGSIVINPDYIYRLPLNIQDLVFLTKIGTAVYGIGKNAEEKSLDEQLLAGFITAANSFISEMKPNLGAERIEIIQSNNRMVRIEFGEVLGLCLVSLKQNYYLIKSMQDLLRYVEKNESMEIIDSGSFFEDDVVRGWLKKFFPYLDIENMQSY